MADVLVFPDVEATVRAWLQPRLQGVSVRTKVTNPREASSVRIQSAGGRRLNMVLSNRVVIVQCWDVSEPASARLAETVSAHLYAAQHDPASLIRRVDSVAEPSSFPDPATSLPRYQFTVSVLLRAQPEQGNN